MPDLPVKRVVTCFLERRGLILLLKRSQKVGSFRGRWAGVSGFVESSPDAKSLIEIQEETGLSPRDIQLVRQGQSLEFVDNENNIRWVVYPYLYRIKTAAKIQTDWEHCDSRWIKPAEMDSYDTVPGLKETLKQIYPF
jgi:8-oxo-dGTP diphosphatase